jgi:excisionase family DNA binding protein
MIFTSRWYTVAQVAQLLNYVESKVRMLIIIGQLRSIKDGRSRRILTEWVEAYVQDRVERLRTSGDESKAQRRRFDFPVPQWVRGLRWITTPLGKRQRKYVYGRTQEIVHGRWVELTRKAARGPVVTKVPTIGQFIDRWLEETVAPNLAPLTYATCETHVKNCIELESMPCGLIVFASRMSRRGSSRHPAVFRWQK